MRINHNSQPKGGENSVRQNAADKSQILDQMYKGNIRTIMNI